MRSQARADAACAVWNCVPFVSSNMAPSPKPKDTSAKAKKAEERSSAGVSHAYLWNATFPANRRDWDGKRVFSSRQSGMLDEIGGAANSDITTGDAATSLEIETHCIVSLRIYDKSNTQHAYNQKIHAFENFCLRALLDDHEEISVSVASKGHCMPGTRAFD